MNERNIETANDVYQFVEKVKAAAGQRGVRQLIEQFDDALLLGSSGLEILGAIRQVMLGNRNTIVELAGPEGDAQINQVIAFIDRTFRRSRATGNGSVLSM